MSPPLWSLAPDIPFALLRTLFPQLSPSGPPGSALASSSRLFPDTPTQAQAPTSAPARSGLGTVTARRATCLRSRWALKATPCLSCTRTPRATALTRCSTNRPLKPSRDLEQGGVRAPSQAHSGAHGQPAFKGLQRQGHGGNGKKIKPQTDPDGGLGAAEGPITCPRPAASPETETDREA